MDVMASVLDRRQDRWLDDRSSTRHNLDRRIQSQRSFHHRVRGDWSLRGGFRDLQAARSNRNNSRSFSDHLMGRFGKQLASIYKYNTSVGCLP